MNHDQFTYWLQGFVEMNGGKDPTKEQWRMIKDHLQTCFVKVTPTYPQSPTIPDMWAWGPAPYTPYDLKPYTLTVSTNTIKTKKNGGGGGC